MQPRIQVLLPVRRVRHEASKMVEKEARRNFRKVSELFLPHLSLPPTFQTVYIHHGSRWYRFRYVAQ